MKAKTIQIKTIDEGLKDFVKTCKAISENRPVKKQRGTFFASLGAVRKVLTENRLQLLKTIKKHKPDSIYELAKLTHRDFKNIWQDIVFLHELGLVDLGKPHGARSQRRPTLASDHIHLELAI